MRTTVDLPDELMKKAKMKAIEEGITFKEFVIKSIKGELKSSQNKRDEKPWKSLRGTGELKDYQPGDSAFDEDWMPESEFFDTVNESDSKNEDE